MRKIFILIMALLISLTTSTSFAAMIEDNAKVAVMDFGTHPDAVTWDINIFNAGKTANEYVTNRLFKSGKMDIMDRFMVEDKIAAAHLNTTGLIDPDTAKRIGQMLGVKYIIYGNVNDVTLSDVGTKIGIGGVTICTVKAHLILRIMNVETGDIIMAAKGEGKSKSSYVKIKGGEIATMKIGQTSVTQDSVHNAILGASNQTVDLLIERLYGVKK